jgi:precorrin-6B methylase 2
VTVLHKVRHPGLQVPSIQVVHTDAVKCLCQSHMRAVALVTITVQLQKVIRICVARGLQQDAIFARAVALIAGW